MRLARGHKVERSKTEIHIFVLKHFYIFQEDIILYSRLKITDYAPVCDRKVNT